MDTNDNSLFDDPASCCSCGMASLYLPHYSLEDSHQAGIAVIRTIVSNVACHTWEHGVSSETGRTPTARAMRSTTGVRAEEDRAIIKCDHHASFRRAASATLPSRL
jgi:hypothetical protein